MNDFLIIAAMAILGTIAGTFVFWFINGDIAFNRELKLMRLCRECAHTSCMHSRKLEPKGRTHATPDQVKLCEEFIQGITTIDRAFPRRKNYPDCVFPLTTGNIIDGSITRASVSKPKYRPTGTNLPPKTPRPPAPPPQAPYIHTYDHAKTGFNRYVYTCKKCKNRNEFDWVSGKEYRCVECGAVMEKALLPQEPIYQRAKDIPHPQPQYFR